MLTHGVHPNETLHEVAGVQTRFCVRAAPGFYKLWVGQTVSEFGSRITRGGIPLIAVITLARPPPRWAFSTAVASVPVLLFGLFAGVWVDRLRRRPILIAMDLARMVLLLTIPAAALTGHLNIELLYVVVAAMSVLGLVFETAYHAYLPSLVEREQIVEGNSRLSTSESLAEIGGPAIAGRADPGDQRAAGDHLRRADLPVLGVELRADPQAGAQAGTAAHAADGRSARCGARSPKACA